ncbi:hypothetical protein D3C81_1827850 [compost metagenome]
MGQVAEQVGGGAARGSGQQHQADGQGRLQPKTVGNQETHQRQQKKLAGQADDHRFGVLHYTSEIGQCQRQTKAKHDDAQGERQEGGKQGRSGHDGYSDKGSSQSRPGLNDS